jgi:hypothetical protein
VPPPPAGGGGGGDGGSAGPAYSGAFDHPLQPAAGPATTIRDTARPTVSLKVRVNKRHRRFSLHWNGADTGGSGLKFFTLQVKTPGGRFRTVKAGTRKHVYVMRGRRAGRYAFRVRAMDGAGNPSRWSLRRAVLRSR